MTTLRLTRAEGLAAVTTFLALLHHADHVLRFDHSGWPFKPEVTPFTFSLLVYVLIGFVFLLRAFPRARVALATVLFLFPTLAHVYLETPADQYHTWAHNPEVNVLRTNAPLLGATAVVITILLSALAFATLIAFVIEARKKSVRGPMGA
jgi:glucan phosphoethanolaminetransferase (alkaline phosphatase superfamily)